MTTRRMARLAVGTALALVTAYGALLRLDTYTSRYGTLARPAWARIATHTIEPAAARIKPPGMAWPPVSPPYVGGDPINYLKYGREMTTFYQPHVREPLFLAVTRVSLLALDGQDAAVSLASAIGSLLAIVGTYLLVATLATPVAGLAAAGVIALDAYLISWSVDGWRDDLFTATVAFSAWALVRFHRRPDFRNALLAGITCGLACLTRITALSFVAPAFAWVTLARGETPWRPRLEYAAAAGVVLAAVVGPYLLSCAIATGDPLYAINYHTTYYRAAEGMPLAQPMSAGSYLRAKLATHPVGMLDTGMIGMFVRPFATKWTGLGVWSAALPPLLRWLALAGLLGLPFSRSGRLLLVILFGSLLPFAFTWNLGDGGAWRFTMHVYPLYVAAAMVAAHSLYRGLRYLRQRPPAWRAGVRRISLRAATVAAVAAIAAFAYARLPWYVVNESLARRDSVSVEAGDRDVSFFENGWSNPHTEGLATVRVSREPKASVAFPLPDRAECELVLRLDPVAPAAGQSLTVLFNSQVVLRTALGWDPSRVGAYRVHLPAEWIHPGANRLTLVTEPLVAAASAGPRFAWLDGKERIGVRFWYLRLVPLAPPGS